MSLTFRPATLDDSFTVFKIFATSITDLSRRLGVMAITEGDDPAVQAELWQRRQPLFEHLARTADQFWLAEQAGQAVGYARSIVRAGVRELTEFFVVPDQQSAGVGRELLARAFPPDKAAQGLSLPPAILAPWLVISKPESMLASRFIIFRARPKWSRQRPI
jgi:GNAT superfamily N-acetyltransferase